MWETADYLVFRAFQSTYWQKSGYNAKSQSIFKKLESPGRDRENSFSANLSILMLKIFFRSMPPTLTVLETRSVF